jgi:hypothetical protein
MVGPSSRLDRYALDQGCTIPGGRPYFVLRKVASCHPFGACSSEVDSVFDCWKTCTPLVYRRLVDRLKMDLFIGRTVMIAGLDNTARDLSNNLKP